MPYGLPSVFSACMLAFVVAAAAAETPVLVSAEQLCEIAIDGDAPWALPAMGTKRIALAPGEHVVDSTCGGHRSRQIVRVGSEQKVVVVGSAAASPPVTSPPAPAARASAPRTDSAPAGGYGPVRRTSPPASMSDLGGDWTLEVRKKQKTYSCPVTISTLLGSIDVSTTMNWAGPDWKPGDFQATVGSCDVLDARVSGDLLSFDLHFGDIEFVPAGSFVDPSTGASSYYPGGSVHKERKSFSMRLVGGELAGQSQKGDWSITLRPVYSTP